MKSRFLRTSFKILLIGIAALSALFLLLLLLHWQTTIVSKTVENYLNSRFDGYAKIEFSDIKGGLINNLKIENLNIIVEDQMSIETKNLSLSYSLWPLLSNEIIIQQVRLENLQLTLFENQKNREDQVEQAFNLDSTLARLENATIIDSLLNIVPLLSLDRLEVEAGMVSIKGQDSLLITNIYILTSMNLEQGNLDFTIHKCRADLPQYDIELKKLSFNLLGKFPQLTLNKFQLFTEDSQVLFSGDVMLTDSIQMILSLDRFYVSYPEINKILKMEGLDQGYISGEGFISGAPRFFNTRISFSGNYLHHRLDSLYFDFDYDYGMIGINTLEVQSNHGAFNLQGVLDLRSTIKKSTGGWGSLWFKNINLDAFVDDTLPSNLNGNLVFKTKSLDFSRLTGNGEFDLYNTQIDTYRIDSLRFALEAENGDISIWEPSFIKFSDQAAFYLTGNLGKDKLVDFRIQAREGDLLHFTQSLGLDSMTGKFYADLRATGYIMDPDVSGELSVSDFQMSDITFDSTMLDFDVQKILTSREGYVKFRIDSGMVMEVPVSDIVAHAEIDSNIFNISQLGFRSDNNYLSSDLNLQFVNDTLLISSNYFRSRYLDYYLENEGAISVIIDSNMVSLEQLRFKGPQSSELEIHGFYDFNISDLQVAVYLNNITLKPFEQFLGPKHSFDGIVDGTIEVLTPLTSPELEIDIKGKDLEYNSVTFGDIVSIFDYSNQNIVIEQFSLAEGDATLDVTGDMSIKLGESALENFNFLEQTKANMRINVENINLAHYKPLLDTKSKMQGIVTGYLETEGTVNEPYVRQSLRLHDFQFDDIKVDSMVMFGQYSSGYLIVDSLSAVLNESAFSLKGWQRFDLKLDDIDTNFTSKPFEFLVQSSDDRIEFLGLFNDQVESIRGDYDLELYLGGTPEHPTVSAGHFSLSDGEMLLSRIRDPITEVNLNATVVDSVMTINEFTGYSEIKDDFIDRLLKLFYKAIAMFKGKSTKTGHIAAQGTVGMHDITRPALNLNVEMQQFYIDYFIENTSLVLNTDKISITGQDTIIVSGDVNIPEGRYEVDLSQMQKNIYLTAPESKPTPPFIVANLNILIPGNFQVTSSPLDLANNFKIMMEGELGVRMNPDTEDPRISGHLNTVSGKYASWNQNFEVENGSILFTNPEAINPDIDLTAEKKINKYKVQLIIGGNLEKQSYNIRVLDQDGNELSMSMPEKLALLTLGTDLALVTSKSDSTLRSVGEDVATTSVLTAVERSAETFTGLDKVEISSDDKMLDLQKMKLNNGLKDASISFGKYLTSDLYVEYRTNFGKVGSGIPAPRLSWDTGNRIGLQYRINRLWSMDSFYEKTLLGRKIKIGLSWEYTF